ncbi:MAG: hypothetical protein E6054_24735, partial [Klebsiella michiganensis]|nr:hypothetical protein [Klebsiella michiganensis]
MFILSFPPESITFAVYLSRNQERNRFHWHDDYYRQRWQAEECTRFHFREQYQICALNGRFISAAKQARKRLLSLLELRRFLLLPQTRGDFAVTDKTSLSYKDAGVDIDA